MKRAVIYYSLEGNTQAAALTVANALHADIFAIEPRKPIARTGWRRILTGGMQSSLGLCTKIKEMPLNIGDYDQIILGTPVWAGKCAAPVWSFIKAFGSNELDQKVTAVFTCSGGGDNNGCMKQLKKCFHHIQTTAALADKNNPACADNEAKLMELIRNIS